MATTIYEYLLRRKADLEARMVEAQRRAQLPFEDELKALGLALGAIERAGLGEGVAGEPASFASDAAPRRGRKSRSARDMILLVLGKDDHVVPAEEIAQQLTRRWGRAFPVAAILVELQHLEQEGLVRRAAEGWVRVEERRDETPAFNPPMAISA